MPVIIESAEVPFMDGAQPPGNVQCCERSLSYSLLLIPSSLLWVAWRRSSKGSREAHTTDLGECTASMPRCSLPVPQHSQVSASHFLGFSMEEPSRNGRISRASGNLSCPLSNGP